MPTCVTYYFFPSCVTCVLQAFSLMFFLHVFSISFSFCKWSSDLTVLVFVLVWVPACACLLLFPILCVLSKLSFSYLSMCSGIADSGWAVPSVQCGSHSQTDGGGEGAHSGAPHQSSGHATPWTHHCFCCCHCPTCGFYSTTFSGVHYTRQTHKNVWMIHAERCRMSSPISWQLF